MTTLRLLATPLAVAILAAAPPVATAQARGEAPPNIIVFVGDDLGWRDTDSYGNRFLRTPSIDRLARSGLRVQYAFGTTPQCSPSRISTLTGKYAHAVGGEALHTPLPDGERILPFYLQERGYFTGHMAKTHYGPNAERRFQWYSPKIAGAFPAFLDSAGSTRPFFLWVGFHQPHRPHAASAGTSRHSPGRVIVPPHLADTPGTRKDLAFYYDAISRMDDQIGLVLADLERRKLRDNTLVVFLSDNWAPFPREKGTLYDSGTRTPLIFSWPRHIPAGSVYDGGLATTVDLTPTILELAGAALPETMQGRSFRTMLTQLGSYPGRTHVFSQRNWHDCDEQQRAVRTQRFKLIRTDAHTALPLCTAADIGASPSFLTLRARAKAGRLSPAQQRLLEAPRARLELYDLTVDPWELPNVADDPAYAKTVRELAGVLLEWMEPFSTKIPPLRNVDIPPPGERWGKQGPT